MHARDGSSVGYGAQPGETGYSPSLLMPPPPAALLYNASSGQSVRWSNRPTDRQTDRQATDDGWRLGLS